MNEVSSSPIGRLAPAPLAALGAVYAALVYATSFVSGYGVMLDEFYYLACAFRPALGYVDHPPLYPLLLRVNVELLGESLAAIRLLPALAGGLVVFLAGWMASRLGGDRVAQIVAALAVMLAPVLLAIFSFASMNWLEVLWWTLATAILVERCRSGDPRWWLAFGLVVGLSFETKHTVAILLSGVGVAIVLSDLRRDLRSRWLWLGVALALLLALPNAAWQIQHDWPSLEFYANADREGNLPSPPWVVLIDQLFAMNLGALALAGAGVLFFLRTPRTRPLGWLVLALLVFAAFAGKSRPDRLCGVHPLIFAGGAVALASARTRAGPRWTLRLSLVAMGAMAVLAAPIAVPLLPPESVAKHPLTEGAEIQAEVGASRLPVTLAHRTGWEGFVADIDGVLDTLPPAARAGAVFLVDDYGHAGALERQGRSRPLPPVASPHNTGYLWGPPELAPGGTVIAVGIDDAWLDARFGSVRLAAVSRCRWCNLWLDEVPIHVVSDPVRPMADLWPELKRYGNASRKLRLLRERDR